MRVYDLTPLTRGAAEARRTIVSGIEFKLRNLVIAGFGGLVGLVPTALLWPVLSNVAVLCVPLAAVGLLWLVEGSSTRGMRLKNWQSLKNRATNNSGKFFVSGEEFDPLANRPSLVVVRALPVPGSDAGVGVVLEDSLVGSPVESGAPPVMSRSVRAAMASWVDGPDVEGVVDEGAGEFEPW